MNVKNFQKNLYDILLAHQFSKLGISLSGGLDSSILLYILCDLISANDQLLKTIKIIPITGTGETNIEVVENIINFVKNKFPKVIFENHEFIHYTDNFFNKWKLFFVPKFYELSQSNKIDVIMAATTLNLPEEELSKYNVKGKVDTSRNRNSMVDTREIFFRFFKDSGYYYWSPLLLQDKKITKSFYDELELHDTLGKMTWSCVLVDKNKIKFDETKKIITEPCKECYWCIEKKWAFECY